MSKYIRIIMSKNDIMDFLTLIVRYFDEPFINEFVEYYLAEGVDKIYILYDIKSSIPIPQSIIDNSNVIIRNSANMEKHELFDVNRLYEHIRDTSEWFIFVDCDEFISTKSNPLSTIRNELMTTFVSADCVKIPWVMMSCNYRKTDPPNILQTLNTRWNHDNRHPHPTNWPKGRCRYDEIEVKSIFRGSKFTNVLCHHPIIVNKTQLTLPKQQKPKQNSVINMMSLHNTSNAENPDIYTNIVCVDGVYNRPATVNPFYPNLRERDIGRAVMLCYHYRIFSKQSCRRKFKNNKISAYQTNHFNELWVTDYSEVQDDTLLQKSILKFGNKNDINVLS